jgi:hypothetical protein
MAALAAAFNFQILKKVSFYQANPRNFITTSRPVSISQWHGQGLTSRVNNNSEKYKK